MSRLEVNIEYIEQQTIYGLWKKSNDRTISKDINALSKQYYAVVSMPKGNVLPYFVLSRNYNKKSHDFELFIGSVIDKGSLESCVLSANEYAKFTEPNVICMANGFWKILMKHLIWNMSIIQKKQ